MLIAIISTNLLFAEEDTLDVKIRKLIEVLGTKKQFEVPIDNMLEIQKRNLRTDWNDDFWMEFRTEIKKPVLI